MQTHLCITLCQAAITVSLAGIPSAWSQTIYRCANLYSDRACPGATQVDADDSRSARQKADTDSATRQIARVAEQLERDRHTLENAPQKTAPVTRPATTRSHAGARGSQHGPGSRPQPAKPSKTPPSEPFTATALVKPPVQTDTDRAGPALKWQRATPESARIIPPRPNYRLPSPGAGLACRTRNLLHSTSLLSTKSGLTGMQATGQTCTHWGSSK